MKLNKHTWAVWGITLIAAIALMILIPFTRTASWWIAACCTVLMFGLCAYTFVLTFRKDNTLESKVFGWPIFKVGYTALIAQIVVGAILMGIASFCPVWVVVIVELILFAGTGLCLIAKDAAREVVRNREASIADRTSAWRTIRNQANALAAETGNNELRKLVDEIRYADPTPTSLDSEIAQILEALASNADTNNIKRAYTLLAKRKTVAKAEKNK